MAAALEVSQSTIARIETGDRQLLFFEALELAEFYGVSPKVLAAPPTRAERAAFEMRERRKGPHSI